MESTNKLHETSLTSVETLLTKGTIPNELPRELVSKMIETTEYSARQSAHKKEREEIVCRLLASGMEAPQISLILKIRKEEIEEIQSNNAKIKIPEYAKTYKSRLKIRERAKKQ